MQNSTQWCNLYSGESKYNIRLVKSSNQQAIQYCIEAITLLLVCYIIHQLYMLAIITSPLKSTVNIALILCIVIIVMKGYHRLPKHQIKYLVLHNNGLIDCDRHSQLSLHLNSRIGWFGCWLILIDSRSKQLVNPIKLFIFKDSLSPRDYCRLSRAVLSNHRKKSTSPSPH
ncbi:protein YgfX [Thalassotalea sp. SU-HH00458]|uniref:protein YgfX n=1 Tax=Thalassotalea sp. SU-HH00458 TaxID=3127657 RepID=UPI0033657F99